TQKTRPSMPTIIEPSAFRSGKRRSGRHQGSLGRETSTATAGRFLLFFGEGRGSGSGAGGCWGRVAGRTPYPRGAASASAAPSPPGTLSIRPHFGHLPTRPGVAPFAFIRKPQEHDRIKTLMRPLESRRRIGTNDDPS